MTQSIFCSIPQCPSMLTSQSTGGTSCSSNIQTPTSLTSFIHQAPDGLFTRTLEDDGRHGSTDNLQSVLKSTLRIDLAAPLHTELPESLFPAFFVRFRLLSTRRPFSVSLGPSRHDGTHYFSTTGFLSPHPPPGSRPVFPCNEHR